MRAAPFIEPGVHAITADEMDLAHKTFARAHALGTNAEGHELSLNSLQLDLGQVFHEILSNGWCKKALGVPFHKWVNANFKNSRGEAMTEDTAKFLAKVWLALKRYPMVEDLVRHGDPVKGQFTCRTSAYWAIMTAELSDWQSEELTRLLSYDPTMDGATAMHEAKRAVQNRLIAYLRKWNAKQIQDEYQVIKNDLKAGGPKFQQYVRLSSPVVSKPVHEKTMTVLARLVDMSGEKANVQAMTPTNILQRLAGFAEDSLYAMEQAKLGNKKPLEALLGAVKETA